MTALAATRAARQQAFVLRQLVRRDFGGRYAGTLLGFLWPFALPLLQLVLFTFVFSGVMKVSPGAGARTDSFALFLFCGLLPWMALQEGIQRAATAIPDNARLLKQHRLAPELPVLAAVTAALAHAAIAAAIFVAVLAGLGELHAPGLPLLLLALPLQAMLTAGIALLAAALHVFFRDTAQLLAVALQGWFFLTPIVYPLSLVPERFRPWLEANPLTALVALYRAALLGADGAGWRPGLPLLGTVAAALLVAGLAVFRRLRRTFVDHV